jgi:hypothetical protein
MILDDLLEFADATSVAASAGTALIGDVIDLGGTTNYIGQGEPLYLVIQTTTEIITGGSAGTIQFFLVSDASAGLGSATVANCTTHLTSNSYTTDDDAANSAELNAGGVIICAALPHGAYERYLGILCTTGTTTTTAGAINAFLTKEPSKYINFADGI